MGRRRSWQTPAGALPSFITTVKRCITALLYIKVLLHVAAGFDSAACNV